MNTRLEVLQPDEHWDPEQYSTELALLQDHADELTIRIWCGDWCKDCRAILPAFGAALATASFPESSIHEYPVQKAADGSKEGPKVDEYGIERIPTIILEREGNELARFVESAPNPPLVELITALETDNEE